ncbi:hypothetical protein RHGRI_015883 [Rhododendron griersonianum]|uniref:Secreted protein n=1 Tax=Rhododendron griersonianum TaxID=479676 RepID=A0AAV6JRW1_9ERIC|nr:hypothetical protein RHGRI_015883 [Rhododendron griersonianum]
MGFQHVGFVALLWTATLRTSRLLHQSHGSSSTGLIDASLKLLSIVRLSVINRVQGYWKTVTEPCSLATKGVNRCWHLKNVSAVGVTQCFFAFNFHGSPNCAEIWLFPSATCAAPKCMNSKLGFNMPEVLLLELVPAFGSANFLFAE